MAVKRQHYVWRGYLKRWNKDGDRFGRIHVYRKRVMGGQKEIDYALLENVGFGKYYYDMTGFSKADVNLVSQLIAHMQKNRLVSMGLNPELLGDANAERDFVESILGEYENIDNTSQFLEKIISGDLSFYRDSFVQTVQDELKGEMIRAVFGCGTKSNTELMAETINAMSHLEDDDPKYDFLRFFFMQYLRSPSIHKAQMDTFENMRAEHNELEAVNANFYVNSIMVFFAEQLALNVSQNLNTWIERYENKTNIPFITTDTPVLNLTGTEFLDRNEFYYPLSPKVAMKLCLSRKEIENDPAENKNLVITDENEVMQLNLRAARACYNEVFADNEEILKGIQAELCG